MQLLQILNDKKSLRFFNNNFLIPNYSIIIKISYKQKYSIVFI